MKKPRLVLVTVVATTVAGLSACGGGSDEPAAKTSTTPATSSPTSSMSSGPGTATEAPLTSYLPTPDGVTLTEPGSQLALKESAVVAWTPRQDLVAVVDVAVTRIEQTTVKQSLARFDLSDAERASTPYFVRTVVTNAGETDLGARQLPVYLLDSAGSLVAPTGLARDFAPCAGSTLPAVFAPADRAQSCLVFLVPEGLDVQSVMFRPPEGVVPITWNGKVRPLESDKPGGKGDAGGKGGKGGKNDNGASSGASGPG